MMKKTYIGAALACALAMGAWSGSALATPQNVGGVVVDPNSPLDLNIQAINFRESPVANVGDVVKGYGEIGSVNGTSQSTFCPGCDLNFTFQYTVKSITSGTNPQIVFDNGTLDFYVDNTNGFDVLDPSTAGVGSLWLSLSGHAAPNDGYSTDGQLYSTVVGTPGEPGNGSTGFGLLDVTGGAAAFFTNTNTVDDGNGGLADFSLDSSFQTQDVGITGADGTTYPISGEGSLIGSSVAVPEPGAIGMMGLGVGFLALALRRRRKETDGRA